MSQKPTHANVDGSMTKSSQKEITLGIKTDIELTFEDHVNFVCKKASQKLYPLARIPPIMDLKQRRNIMKAFVESQFGYYPLIWMFHSRGLNNKINRIHERALTITYKDKFSSIRKRQLRINTSKTCYRNLQSISWFFSNHFKLYICARLTPE